MSTDKQGRSGLGLEAQRKAVSDFLANGDTELVAEYVETESGKRDDRPKLKEALHYAQVTGSTLVIAKLDRLSRDACFLLTLQKAGTEFVCADMPEANNLTIGIMALVAQQEREAISKRTKEALAAAKARGVKLGCPIGAKPLEPYRAQGGLAGAKANREKADKFAEKLKPIIADCGTTSPRKLARELNARGIVTPRGGRWHATSVKRLLERLGVA